MLALRRTANLSALDKYSLKLYFMSVLASAILLRTSSTEPDLFAYSICAYDYFML